MAQYTSAFADHVGSGGSNALGASVKASDLTADQITGTATYKGSAAGKYAYKGEPGSADHGGHFTADAELKANFGTITTANTDGVTGTINNFRLNDESTDSSKWSVKLEKANIGSNTGMLNVPTDGTVWSIDGTAATESGTWSGTMYDEKVIGDSDDGSNIPTTVIGEFYSEFGSFGRMVGAFGANHSGD